MKMKYVFICLLSLISMSIFAQKNDDFKQFPKEKVFLYTNNTLFVSGEEILYKIYCFQSENNTLSNLSKIAYVDLIDKNNNSISKQKINLENGLGDGVLFLKTNIKTGGYKLIAYTHWMLNFETFFEEDIFIINPFSEKLQEIDSLKTNPIITNKSLKTSILKPTTNKKTYNKRENVIVNLNTENIEIISVSVKKQNNFKYLKTASIVDFIEEEINTKKVSRNTFLPEVRGEIFKGKVFSNSNLDLTNLAVSISFIGENKITKIVKTNKDGDFFFTVNKNYSAKNVFAEVIKKGDYNVKINTQKNIEKKFKNFKQIYLTEALRKLIKERSKNIQIENAYNQVKKVASKKNKINTYVFEKNKNKKTYNLDDFTRFKTVKEVAVEILQDVWISKNKEEFAFHIRDVNLVSNTNLETLLIVDGFVINNHTNFIYYDALKISTIDIIRSKYKFGSKIYQGIININTLKNDYIPNSKNKFSLLKPENKKPFFLPNYNQNKNKRIPDLRNQLYWNTDLNVAKKFSFFTSDIVGTFSINLQGILKDGSAVNEEITFKVE